MEKISVIRLVKELRKTVGSKGYDSAFRQMKRFKNKGVDVGKRLVVNKGPKGTENQMKFLTTTKADKIKTPFQVEKIPLKDGPYYSPEKQKKLLKVTDKYKNDSNFIQTEIDKPSNPMDISPADKEGTKHLFQPYIENATATSKLKGLPLDAFSRIMRKGKLGDIKSPNSEAIMDVYNKLPNTKNSYTDITDFKADNFAWHKDRYALADFSPSDNIPFLHKKQLEKGNIIDLPLYLKGTTSEEFSKSVTKDLAKKHIGEIVPFVKNKAIDATGKIHPKVKKALSKFKSKKDTSAIQSAANIASDKSLLAALTSNTRMRDNLESNPESFKKLQDIFGQFKENKTITKDTNPLAILKKEIPSLSNPKFQAVIDRLIPENISPEIRAKIHQYLQQK